MQNSSCLKGCLGLDFAAFVFMILLSVTKEHAVTDNQIPEKPDSKPDSKGNSKAKRGVKFQKRTEPADGARVIKGKVRTTEPKKQRRAVSPFKSRLKKIIYYGAVTAVWGVIVLIILLAYLARGIPDLDNPPSPGADKPTLIIKARNGYTLVRTGPVYGDWLSYEKIPKTMTQALVATEDKNFYSHNGLDGMGLMRALYLNLSSGRVRAGGSTITQQLAKNLFLTEARTVTRKAQELLLTFWLEQKFSKQQIMTLYLNRVYFGGGAYGLDAAARKYFGHGAGSLSIKEAAILTGLLKAPSRYAPHVNPDGSWQRAGVVLKRLEAQGILTAAARKTLAETPPDIIRASNTLEVGYFADYVTRQARDLMDRPGQSMIIHTTLEPGSQRAAADSLKDGINREGVRSMVTQGSIVSLDHDGAIRALVGGVNYGESQYDRASQAVRQPGSAFKIFSYIAGLEVGIKPDDIYVDQPINIEGYQPTNYSKSYRGKITVTQAFMKSINTVAVQIAEQAGREKVVEVAKRLGITTPVMPHASLPLGTEEVKMIDLAAAYAAIASGGHRVAPYAILEISSLKGEILYRRQLTPPVPVISYPVVEQMTAMMTATIDKGTGKNARIDRPAGGKSGTSQDSRDAVFAGFTSDMTTVVWVGNDDDSAMQSVTGGGLPARIWAAYNIKAHAGTAVRPLLSDAGFNPPPPKPKKKKKKKNFFQRLFN